MGFISILICSFTSGFASVYFEKVLKGHGSSETSLWIYQARMAFSGLIFALIMMILNDGHQVVEKGFFYGYNSWTVFSVFWQGLGGLLVAMVIKYADNILKSFATSISIIFTYYFSYLIFGSTLTLTVIIGSLVVILSVFLYNV